MSEFQKFFTEFEQQNFSEAAAVFKQLDKHSQQELLKELYYQARNAKSPKVVGVLYRKLHEGKNFDDFYKAWFPSAEYTKPEQIGEKTYYNFFPEQTRVINAVNIEDPSEVISIGLTWVDEEKFADWFKTASEAKSNTIRRDNISEVAEKISTKVYAVKADTELGS